MQIFKCSQDLQSLGLDLYSLYPSLLVVEYFKILQNNIYQVNTSVKTEKSYFYVYRNNFFQIVDKIAIFNLYKMAIFFFIKIFSDNILKIGVSLR